MTKLKPIILVIFAAFFLAIGFVQQAQAATVVKTYSYDKGSAEEWREDDSYIKSGSEKCMTVHIEKQRKLAGSKTGKEKWCIKCDATTNKCESTKEVKEGEDAGISCMPMPVKLKESRGCFLCPLFVVIFNTVNTMCTQSFTKFGKPMAAVMMLGFALWIAFTVLTTVSSMSSQELPKFLGGLFMQSFKVMFAFILLQPQYAQQLYYYVIEPILLAGLDFGINMMKMSGSITMDSGSGNTVQEGFLSVEFYNRLDAFITQVQNSLASVKSIGATLMCVGFKETGGFIPIDFGLVIQGLIIYVFCFLMIVAFGFYLIDATVQLGIVGALMPFFVAAWPFKPTAKFWKTGWSIFLNTFFVYLMTGMVVAITCQMIISALDEGVEIETTDITGKVTGKTKLTTLLNEGGNMADISDAMSLFSTAFLVLICSCVFAFKFIDSATKLADKMAGGAGIKIGGEIGGFAVSGMVNAGKKVGGKVGGAAKAGVAASAKSLGNKAGAKLAKSKMGQTKAGKWAAKKLNNIGQKKDGAGK